MTRQRGQVDPTVLLVLAALAVSWWLAMEAWRGLKWTGHHVGCGVKVVFTGRHCAPYQPKPLPPNPVLEIEVD